jgi:hypothetical protein
MRIEIVCSQLTKAGVGARLGGWDDVPNLHRAVCHDHPINQQLDELAALLKGRLLQADPQPSADVAGRLRQRLDLDQTLACGGDPSLLPGGIVLALPQLRVFALERDQLNRSGQVRLQ